MKTPTLKVLLRDRASHQFFAGAGEWVPERFRAFNFERPEHAANLSKANAIPEAEIILEYPGEPGELAVSLAPSAKAHDGSSE